MKKKRNHKSEEEKFNELLFYSLSILVLLIAILLTFEKYGIV